MSFITYSNVKCSSTILYFYMLDSLKYAVRFEVKTMTLFNLTKHKNKTKFKDYKDCNWHDI